MRRKLLLVDDEEIFREIIVEIMIVFDLEIFHAGNGIEALELLEKQSIDMIFTDLKMPKMTGREFLIEMGRRGISIPTIVLSGYGDETVVLDCMKLGAVSFIHKPFSREDIMSNMSMLLRDLNLKDMVKAKRAG